MDQITNDEVFAELGRLRTAGTPFCLATVVRVEAPTSAKPGDKAVITADGKMVGWIGGSCSEAAVRREAQRALHEAAPRVVRIEPINGNRPSPAAVHQVGDHEGAPDVVLATTCPSGGTLEIFLEPQVARPQLVAFGASPAARTLVRLARLVGFRTCAVHLGATLQDFPDADLVLPRLEPAAAGVGADSWLVVATMGHYDEEALEAALRSGAAYVGLVASRRRRNAIVRILRDRGWSGDKLSGIVNPAGRALADTQEEIALSVLADIVSRRQRRRKPLTSETTAGGEHAPSVFATDPICGMAVEIGTARHRSGDTYFCGRGCLESFEAAQAAHT